jgi:lipopolysaccharide/colanic/teichoic acid biosynthesis glycosyltransferase
MVTALLEKARRFKHRKIQPQEYPKDLLKITLTPAPYIGRKSIVDLSLALLLLLPGLPLMAILFICVRLTSRGPALFRQNRVGRFGKIFRLYKIRSMTLDAEDRTGPAWAQTADPRVTSVGHFLRKFHLDELPQLFNVLKGEMALVGPRPERPEFVEVLQRQIPAYMNRLAVRPGITGLAQLNLPPDSDLDSVRRKVILDIEYIQTASPWLDLRLILSTALRFVKLPILGVFRLHRSVILPTEEVKDPQSAAVETIVTLQQMQQKVKGDSSNGNGNQGRRNRKHKVRSSKPK